MPHLAFSPDWIAAWAAAIRASDEYRAAAQRWEWPLLFVLRADPAGGIANDRSAFLDLYRGDCREARPGSSDDVALATFVISGDVAAWRSIVEGTLDPIVALMKGALRLDKGSLMTLAMHPAAAKALVATTASLQTIFPPDTP